MEQAVARVSLFPRALLNILDLHRGEGSEGAGIRHRSLPHGSARECGHHHRAAPQTDHQTPGRGVFAAQL